MKHYKLLIIGAGAAGITAAVSAAKAGITGICIVERDETAGGVLNQCLHRGFGMGFFGKEMSGTEYAEALVRLLNATDPDGTAVELRLNTMVTGLSADRTACLSSRGIYEIVSFDSCILATGCRETTLQSLTVAGTRPDGIYTAGEAQKMLNVYGRDIGDDIIILGTGDIGQIMARHYLDAGKNVIAMIEKSDRPGGLERNRREIIDKYNIPVILGATVVEVFGEDRISAVRIRDLSSGQERVTECSTLITAMGLIPERDILVSLNTCTDAEKKQLPDWLYLCGNCDHVHDIVDSVSLHAQQLTSKIFT